MAAESGGKRTLAGFGISFLKAGCVSDLIGPREARLKRILGEDQVPEVPARH